MTKPNAPKPFVPAKRAPKAPEKTFPRPVRPEADPGAATRASDKPARPFVRTAAAAAAASGAVTSEVHSPHVVTVGPTSAKGARGVARRVRDPLPPVEVPTAKGMVSTPAALSVRVEVKAVPPSVDPDKEPPNHVPASYQWPPQNRGVTLTPLAVPALSEQARELARTMGAAAKSEDK